MEIMRFEKNRLERVVATIFAHAGSHNAEATTVARHLVAANLAGHESHGVIRVPHYIDFVRAGKLSPNQSITVVFENDAIAIVDGNFGFGQVLGGQATDLGIAKASRAGVAFVGLRNAGHVGRLGDWALQAAEAGQVSLHFVNTSGFSVLTAPYGGRDRRLSSNPIAAGVPVEGGRPIILDMATSVIAEGKIKVAHNVGKPLPEDAILDANGKPSRDPAAFYGEPPGVLLPFGGYKGYGLSVICDILAGAVAGGGCSNPASPSAKRLVNGMASIFLDPALVADTAAFAEEIKRLIAWLKASPPREPDGEVLMPGEVEDRTTARRLVEGVPLDAVTWDQVLAAAEAVGLSRASLEAAVA